MTPIRLAATAPLGIDEVRESVDYLVREFGVNQAEALRRLELQRLAPALDEQLSDAFPGSYGGMWLDQAGGGTLVVNATSQREISDALRGVPERDHIRIAPVVHTKQSLDADVQTINETYGEIATVDEVTNRVVVHPSTVQALRDNAAHPKRRDRTVPPGVSRLPAAPTALTDGLASALSPLTATGRVEVERTAPPATYDNCTIDSCPPPMRGGTRIQVWDALSGGSWISTCTNGFNVNGSNGWQYTITAGHCLDAYNENYTRHYSRWVGDYDYWTFVGASYPWDGIILPYVVSGGVNYAEYWLSGQPKNRVFFVGKTSLYPISGSYTYEQIGVGWVTCMTGSISRTTRCGSVVAKDNGIVTNICAVHGDSGGPVFSQVDNRAYAIHNRDTTSDNTCPSGYRSYNSALSKLFSSAANHSGISFRVNTA
ncbi:hypothetical protein [Plantactinospora sp. GCM10030261]|uniref:hypothetical protein n=1 Tax=Plantactinospora sp. GCM10030261 TaxID=3273420 RepID=UPI003617FBB9